jgi:hypothetical protein
MPLYHLYFYKDYEHLDHVIAFEQPNEDCAIFEAEHRRTILPMELKQGTVLVRKWDWLPCVPPFP